MKDRLRKIISEIDAIKLNVESMLAELEEQAPPVAPAPVAPAPVAPAPVAPAPARLLDSPLWPEAIPASLICDITNEEDKISRADGIVSMYLTPGDLMAKKFLDFGCGEGHVAKQAAKNGTVISVGYDPAINNEVADAGVLITANMQSVVQHAPFDTILLYDVMDHADQPVSLLNELRSLCSANTRILVRFHPWCSRHGGHFYRKLNKAFAHLIYSEEELPDLVDYPDKPKQKVLFPLTTYSDWIKEAGFRIIAGPTAERTPVESFFEQDGFAQKLIGLNDNSVAGLRVNSPPNSYKVFPRFQMEQSFVDCVIGV